MGEIKKYMDIYRCHMGEIIARDKFLRGILSKGGFLGNNTYDYEVFAIHVRKILEAIAYSSLVANVEKYKERHSGYEEHWKAKGLLECIEEVNPEYYPEPVSVTKTGENQHHIEPKVDAEALTKEEFCFLYDKCNEALHHWRPFAPGANIDFEKKPIEWLDKIRNLMNTHKICINSLEEYWLVQMVSNDGRTNIFQLKALKDSTSS
tara:strand:+ start:12381 stop:12998 length:618 start_codon:yes stop_codon:yes gene_type:complete